MHSFPRRFTGYWIPFELAELFHNGTITVTEMLLVSIIHALCARGDGCTAGNQYLAKCVRVTPSQVKKYLKRLEALNVITRETVNGERAILTYLMTGERLVLGASKRARSGASKDALNEEEGQGRQKTPEGAGKDAPVSLLCRETNNKVITKEGDGGETETGGRQEELPFGESPRPKFSTRVAIQLTKSLLKHRKISTHPKLAERWAQQIRCLIKLDGFTKEEVDTTIQWYRQHIGEKYVPLVYNEKMFRTKFAQIRDRMERSQQETSVAAPVEQLKLTKLEEEILERVLNWQWPKGANARMPQAVRTSLRNFETAMAARRRGFQDPSLERFYDLVDNAFWNANPKTFLADHFHREFDRVKDWEGWSGDLKSVVWSVYHKGFTQRGQEFASQHGGVTLWDKFVAEITS